MKIKQIEEDFVVDEIYDLEQIKRKEYDKKDEDKYYYFKLTKKNYNQIRALEIVANTFNTSSKLVHFAGTKDKFGITSQIISVKGINESNFEKNLEHINSNFDGIKLEFIGKYGSRINLGDNLGNSFKIVIRDMDETETKMLLKNFEIIKNKGVLNFFDSQRFGYANNSHIVGKYALANQMDMAIYEILTSYPEFSDSKILKDFTDFIVANWSEIKNNNISIMQSAISIAPSYLRNEIMILKHLIKYKNDYPGAFRTIHKKLRSLYFNAYQSYIFNEMLIFLSKSSKIDDFCELELVNLEYLFTDNHIKTFVEKLLADDMLSINSFKLSHMPEIKFNKIFRKTRIFPKNMRISYITNDEMNQNKNKAEICFELDSGEYATNVVNQIFNMNKFC